MLSNPHFDNLAQLSKNLSILGQYITKLINISPDFKKLYFGNSPGQEPYNIMANSTKLDIRVIT